MNKKWSMRKYNEGKKPSEKITVSRIKQYLKDYPKTTGVARFILENWHLTDEKIAKKLGITLAVASRFRKLNIRWMSGKRNNRKPKKHVVVCKSRGKKEVREGILELLLDKLSPKVGVVPTLPFNFDFEKMIIKIEQLSGLLFWGYEFAYNVTKGKESRAQFKKQNKILESNRSLGNRVTMFYKNINDVLEYSTPDMYAHVFADYCGTLITNRKAIEAMFSNKVVQVGGIIWITVNPRNREGKRNTITELVSLCKKAGGSNFRQEKIHGEKVYRYQGSESGSGAPMYAVAFRRMK